MNDVVLANLRLQIALQEQALNASMFPTIIPAYPSHSYDRDNCCCMPAVSSCCCQSIMPNFSYSDAYCCETASATDLELAAYVNNKVAPYVAEANAMGRCCCYGKY